MQHLFFWQRWPSHESTLYSIFLFLVALLAISSLTLHILQPEYLIGWETYVQPETISFVERIVESGFFNLNIDLETDIFWQYFTGGESIIPVYSYWLFLGFLALGIVTIATTISFLKKFWFFIGVSLLIAGLASLNFDLLYVFGLGNQLTLGIVLALFVPATYFFSKIRPSVSFMQRWVYFFGVTAALGLVIHLFAQTSLPFMSLATSGIYLALILSAIFLLMVGHEILIGMLTILTSGQPHALRHFLIFCGIYLLMLIFTYLHEVYIISWDIIYLNVVVLIIVSGVLGIWGFRKRETQYSYLMNFGPAGAFFYIAMMLIALATLSHLELTVNDPGIEVFRDFTIIGHLAFGVIFLTYVLANFATPLGKDMAVHKILFEPTSMPYFTFRLVGIITFVALIFPSGTKTSVFQSQAAYFNGLGDLAVEENEPLFALRYYEEGASTGFNNHKSNYSLGKFFSGQGAYDRAIAPLKNATQKWPTPQSYIDLSRAFLATNQPYEALFALKEGVRTFPKNYHILNNLGLIYNEVNVLDSAYLSLNASHISNPSQTTAGSNITGMFAKNKIGYKSDSVVSLYVSDQNILSTLNGLILKSVSGEFWDRPLIEYDSVLSYVEASVVYNQTINALFANDTIDTRWLARHNQHPSNIRFREKIELGEILHLYRNQRVNTAFRKLNSLANWSDDYGHIFYEIGGKWALEQHAPEVALQYFQWADDRKVVKDPLLQAIANSEAHRHSQARRLWESLQSDSREEVADIASTITSIYQKSPEEIQPFDDLIKSLYLRYVTNPMDTNTFLDIWNDMSNGDSKAQVLLHRCQSLVEIGRVNMAIALFEKMAGVKLSTEQMLDRVKWFELELLAARKNIDLLEDQIEKGVEYDIAHETHQHYFTGLIKASKNDTTAMHHFRTVAALNPFYEDALITSVNYISTNDKFEAYDYLVSAIEINPNSVPLLKAYILQCAKTQLNNYADFSLEKLQTLISSGEYNAVYSQYVFLAQQIESEENNF